jgi:hypothetical protein
MVVDPALAVAMVARMQRNAFAATSLAESLDSELWEALGSLDGLEVEVSLTDSEGSFDWIWGEHPVSRHRQGWFTVSIASAREFTWLERPSRAGVISAELSNSNNLVLLTDKDGAKWKFDIRPDFVTDIKLVETEAAAPA